MWGRRIVELEARVKALDEQLADHRAWVSHERQRTAELTQALVAQAAVLEERTRELASARTQLDWMANTITSLNVERASLFQNRWGVSVPVGEVVGVPVEAPAAHAAGPRIVNIGDILDQIRSGRKPAEPTTVDSDDGALFEDMGEERARAAGVTHAPTGEVRYTR